MQDKWSPPRCGLIRRLSLTVSQHLLLDSLRMLWGLVILASPALSLEPQLLPFCPRGSSHALSVRRFQDPSCGLCSPGCTPLGRHCVFPTPQIPAVVLLEGNALSLGALLVVPCSFTASPLGVVCICPYPSETPPLSSVRHGSEEWSSSKPPAPLPVTFSPGWGVGWMLPLFLG